MNFKHGSKTKKLGPTIFILLFAFSVTFVVLAPAIQEVHAQTTVQKFYFHDATSSDTGTMPPSTTESANSPTVTASGASTARAMDGNIGTSQTSIMFASKSFSKPPTSEVQPDWWRRFVSVPLAAQTIASGTWTIRAAIESTSNVYYAQISAIVYVWRPSTGTLVGMIVDAVTTGIGTTAGTSETDTGVATITASGTAQTLQNGDILVIEVWCAGLAYYPGGFQWTLFYDGTTEGSTTSNAAYLNAPTPITLYIPSVTEQVTITPANSYSSSDTASIAGTGCTASTIAMDGTQHTFTCTPSTSLTLTVALSGTAGYSFASNSTTTNWTTGASGGTDTKSFTVYRMYYNTLEVTANAQASFDTGMSWSFTCSHSDTSGGTCVVSSTAVSTDSKKFWTNYNQVITAPAASTSPPANSRWENAAGTTSTAGTPTSGGNTYNTNYWKQWTTTWSAAANARSTFDATMTSAVTGNQYGGSVTLCTITTTSGHATDTCSAYIDNAATATFATTMGSPPASEQWKCATCITGAVTSGATTQTINYYNQLSETWTATSTGRNFDKTSMTGSVTGTSLGSGSVTVCSLSTTSGSATVTCVGYIDYNQAGTFSTNLGSPPSNEAWTCVTCVTSAQTSGGGSPSITYYNELTETWTATSSGRNFDSSSMTTTVKGTVLGTVSITICTITTSNGVATATCAGAIDYNNGATLLTTLSGPPANEQWKCSTCTTSAQTSGGNSPSITYYSQLTETWMAAANAKASFDAIMTAVVKGTVLGSASTTICTITTTSGHATDTCSGYIDYNNVATFDTVMGSPPANERWQCATCVTAAQTTGGNVVTINYYNGLYETYTFSPHTPSVWDNNLSPSITGTSLGTASSTVCTASLSSGSGSASCSGYSDYNTQSSFPSSIADGTGLQWSASGTIGFTDTSGGGTHTVQYYLEFISESFQATPTAPTTWDAIYSIHVVGTYLGAGSTTICTISTSNGGGTATCSGTIDDGTSVTFDNAIVDSTYVRWETGSAVQTPTKSSTTTATYYKQLNNTYAANPSVPTIFDGSITFTVAGTYLGAGSFTICTITIPVSPSSGSYSCSGYADYNLAVSLPVSSGNNPTNIIWTEVGTHSWTDTTGGNTRTTNYYRELTNTYVANPVAPVTFSGSITFSAIGTVGGTGSQTICTITIPASPSSGTYNCVGGADSGTTVTVDATSSNNPDVYTRWQVLGTHAWIDSSGGNSHTANYYEQLQNTYQVTANAQTDFDASMTWAVTGTYLGTGSSTICTISSTVATTDSCTSWADYDLAVTVPQAASSPPANSRWQSSATCPFTQTTGNNVNNCNSYKQWTETWTAAASGQNFDATMTSAVTGHQYGSGTTICTVTTTSGHASDTCGGYIDNAQAATFDTTMTSAPSNEQWKCATCVTSSQTSGGNVVTITYYSQLSNTFKVAANAQTNFDTGMSWAVTGTVLGTSSSTICTISSTAATFDTCTSYSDYNTVTTIPQAAFSPPANSRWYSSAVCSNTPTTGGNTYTCNSYKQWTNQFDYSVTDGGSPTAPTFTANLYGSISWIPNPLFGGVYASIFIVAFVAFLRQREVRSNYP